MEFTTKRELLEYLGKNPDDRKLVDRMIKRWEVYREDWMYNLITDKQSLIDEFKSLRERVKELEKSEPKQIIAVPEWEWIRRVAEEVKDLRSHLSYVWQRNEHRRACIEKMAQAFFEKNRQKYDFEWAMEAFNKVIWFIEDLDENEEREWAISEWLLPF